MPLRANIWYHYNENKMWSVFEGICASVALHSRRKGWFHNSFWKLYIHDLLSLQEHGLLSAYEQIHCVDGEGLLPTSCPPPRISGTFPSSVPAENKACTWVRTPPSLESYLWAAEPAFPSLDLPHSLLDMQGSSLPRARSEWLPRWHSCLLRFPLVSPALAVVCCFKTGLSYDKDMYAT